jgi:hypothetical protein
MKSIAKPTTFCKALWHAIVLLAICAFYACDLKPLPDDLNPGSKGFITTDSRSSEALQIIEKDDAFIVISRFDVYKINKSTGAIVKYLELTPELESYLYADIEEFQDGTMLITSTNGETILHPYHNYYNKQNIKLLLDFQ